MSDPQGQAALDQLVAILDLEELELNLFRGRTPKEDRVRVFGGQVADRRWWRPGARSRTGWSCIRCTPTSCVRRSLDPDRLSGRALA